MKKVFNFLCRVIEVLIIVYVIFITTCILCRNKFGYTQFDNSTLISVTEDTLQYLSNFKENDLLIVKSSNSINVGDKIYYYATINDKYVIKTGIVTYKTSGDTKSIYTLDDEDKNSISSTRVIGRDVSVKKDLGGILDFLESRIGFLLCVLLPILLIFIYQIYELVVIAKYEMVEDISKDSKKKDSIDDVEVL